MPGPTGLPAGQSARLETLPDGLSADTELGGGLGDAHDVVQVPETVRRAPETDPITGYITGLNSGLTRGITGITGKSQATAQPTQPTTIERPGSSRALRPHASSNSNRLLSNPDLPPRPRPSRLNHLRQEPAAHTTDAQI